jgi:hypothetical protein
MPASLAADLRDPRSPEALSNEKNKEGCVITPSAIDECDKQRCAATVSLDLTRSEKLYSDQMIWVHSSGIRFRFFLGANPTTASPLQRAASGISGVMS